MAPAARPVTALAANFSPLVRLLLRFRSGDLVLPSRKESAGIEDTSEPSCWMRTSLELPASVGIRGLPCLFGMTSISIGLFLLTFDSSVAELNELRLLLSPSTSTFLSFDDRFMRFVYDGFRVPFVSVI
jgi:hypothetical protein